LKWTPKGRFQLTLQPDEVKDLGDLVVPASALGTLTRNDIPTHAHRHVIHRFCPLHAACSFAALAIVAIGATGCGRTPPAFFRPNMVEATKQRLKPEQEKQVATILLAMFGTPDEPVCLPEMGLDEAKLRLAAGPVRSDIVGRKNGLYREHCRPLPWRDGRWARPHSRLPKSLPAGLPAGRVQVQEHGAGRQARPHADLVRILHNGIPGTSMPSFALLSEPQVDALAEYVKYLAIRGETEIALMRAFFELDDDAEGKLPETREFLVEETLAGIAEKWQTAADAVIPVPRDAGRHRSGRLDRQGQGALLR